MIQVPRKILLFCPLHYQAHHFQAWMKHLDIIWITASFRESRKKCQMLTARPDNKRICSNFVVYDSSKNPLRNLIPIALEDSILRNAVLALAARHLVNQGKSFHRVQVPVSSEAAKFNHDALFFKHRVIEGLSNTLCDSHCSENNVASIFLLILLDLLESGGDEWQVHLKGAKGLITGSLHQSPLETATEVSQKEPTQMIQGIRDFVIQQIIMWVYSVS
jgi:hypothetical protein